VRFLHEQESPITALEELRTLLQATEEGIPGWLVDMRRRLQALEQRLAEDAQRFVQQLESLCERIESGLERLQALQPQVSDTLAASYPWAKEALAYLDQRKSTGASEPCPLPELFADISRTNRDFTIASFHSGLRLLHDQKALRLIPAQDST